MDEILAEQLVMQRMESWLFGIFAPLAVLLAVVGLYGLISHEVEMGARNTGIRMALGATRGGISALILRCMTVLLASGIVVGLDLTVAARGLVSKWERGGKKPRGASLKLLTLVDKKGLEVVA